MTDAINSTVSCEGLVAGQQESSAVNRLSPREGTSERAPLPRRAQPAESKNNCLTQNCTTLLRSLPPPTGNYHLYVVQIGILEQCLSESQGEIYGGFVWLV